MRELRTQIVLVLVSLSLSAAAVEMAVRWLRPQPLSLVTPGLYEPDPPRRYRLRPDYRGQISNVAEFDTQAKINRHGLRGPAIGPAREPRLLVIGDSFPFGWGVEAAEAFPLALGELLPGWETLNGGVPGFGVPDAVDWLETYGLDLEPDLVVLAVFAGNDLLDATAKHRQVEVQDGLVSADKATTSWRLGLNHHSHFVRLAKSALPWRIQSRLRSFLGLPEPWRVTYLRDALQSYAKNPGPLPSEGLAATRRSLDELRQLQAGHGFEVVMLLVPDVLQTSPQRWQATLSSLGLEPEAYDPETPNRVFGDLAAEHGFPFLDLTPELRERTARGQVLYFTHDPHWNATGHAVAARSLAVFLGKHSLDGLERNVAPQTSLQPTRGSQNGHRQG